MHSYKKRYKKSQNKTTIIIGYLLLGILLLTGGFSAFSANLSINGLAAIRVQRDIRVTNISQLSSSSSAYSNYEDYNVSSVSTSVSLPNSDSTFTYDVTVTNIGNTEMGILSITGLPNNLTYSISNYNLKDILCDDNNSTKCKLGSVTTLHITIGYATNGYNSNNINYNLNLEFEFKEAYSITYYGFSSLAGLPTTILDGETKIVTFNNTTGIPADVATSNATGTYSSPTLTLSGATDDVAVTRKYSITYVDFTGNTSGLISTIGPEGGTIAFNSTTGLPEFVLVSGATGSYNSNTYILTLTDVTSNVTVTMAYDGDVEIVSITRTDILNVTENNAPQITSDGQGVTFDLGVNVDQNNYGQDFYVKYAIVINNDSVYEQKVLATNFTPRIVGTGNVPNVTYTITDANDNPVLNTTIAAKTSATYYLTIDIEPQEQGNWGVEGESSVDTVENGTITGSISGSTQGDLTGSNTITHFGATIINSFDETKSFIFSIDDTRFRIVDSSGNAISSMTIAANTSGTYDFYIKNVNGNNFMTSPCDLNVNVNYDSEVSSVGVVSLLVDVDPTLTDHTAPVISNVTATITSVQKEILVKWTGTDDNTITNYYVETYISDANGNGTLSGTAATLSGAANGTTVSYTATVPTDDTYYYFKVYAKDQSDNTASASDITSCNTSSGYCSRSANEKYKWNLKVTLVLVNATSSTGSVSANGSTRTYTINTTYDNNVSATLSGASNDYNPPSSISSATITYANGTSSNLSSGSSSQTAYSYNTNSHVLNIYHITGDIRITASGASISTCLAEGTKVLMADGSYKKIENIEYDDLLAVWDYENGVVTYEYPLWIEREHSENLVSRVTFDDNSYIDFVGDHAIYSTDVNLFVSVLDKDNFKVGTKVAKLDKNKLVSIRVKSIESFSKEVNYYFVGTTIYNNLFAGDILTADRHLIMSNLYGFDAIGVWPKERKEFLSKKENLLDYSYFKDFIPYYIYKGFRVEEAGYLFNSKKISVNDFGVFVDILGGNQSTVVPPITINNDRYWMVTTSEDAVNNSNKSTFLRKESSLYTLPKSNKKYFKGWYNTSDNKVYAPGDKITVNHGIHFKALYDTNKYFEMNSLNDIHTNLKKH